MSLQLPNFEVALLLNEKTRVETKGTFNPFSQSFQLKYKLITPNIICQKRVLGRDFYLKGEANGTMDQIHFFGDGKIFSSKNNSALASVKFKNGHINKLLKIAKCDYQFQVDNLSIMTKEKYHGNMNILGTILYHKELQITGGAENLGGYAHFHYKGDKVSMKLNSLDAQKILYLLDYPIALDSEINGVIDYNFMDEVSNIDLNMKNINFLNCITTQNLYNALKTDLRQTSFDYGHFRAKTDKEFIYSDFKLQNLNSHLYITKTKIDQSRKTINSIFNLKTHNTKLIGQLSGDLYEPTIKLNMGAMFAFKIKQIMRPTTHFDIKSKFDCIKGVADGLFGGFL